MKPFDDFRQFHPIPGAFTPGSYFASPDGKRTVMLNRQLWRTGEIHHFVEVTINGEVTRIYGEDAYYDWKGSRPLPGHKNGWY